eukprot:SAG11_NODE_1464_length_4862_cov_1.419064_4_plen_41_part_00
MNGRDTLRDLLLGPWHGVAGENDRFKFLAGEAGAHMWARH